MHENVISKVTCTDIHTNFWSILWFREYNHRYNYDTSINLKILPYVFDDDHYKI